MTKRSKISVVCDENAVHTSSPGCRSPKQLSVHADAIGSPIKVALSSPTGKRSPLANLNSPRALFAASKLPEVVSDLVAASEAHLKACEKEIQEEAEITCTSFEGLEDTRSRLLASLKMFSGEHLKGVLMRKLQTSDEAVLALGTYVFPPAQLQDFRLGGQKRKQIVQPE